ncbi:MAG: SIS domain-containing protein [Planctomycetota bacterium]
MKQRIIEAIEKHKAMVAQLEADSIETIAQIVTLITASLKNGGCVYICGNGGSAADAQHIAGEFVGRFLRERKALPAVALTTDTSVLTAIGNDYDFNDIFKRQVEALVGKNDILWAFSTSGSSGNILAAAKLAKDKGAAVIGFTGRPDSKLEAIADLCLCAEADSTAPSQEMHQLAYHIICDLVELNFCES